MPFILTLVGLLIQYHIKIGKIYKALTVWIQKGWIDFINHEIMISDLCQKGKCV